MRSNTRSNTKEFIEKAILKFGNAYSYDKVVYITAKTKIIITCPKHGDFSQTPNQHLCNKIGCPKCGREKVSNSLKYDNDKFINVAKKVHGNKYDYSLVDYIDSKIRVDIICPKHGIFKQFPTNHLKGHGCWDCMTEYIGTVTSLTLEDFIERAKNVHGNKYNYGKSIYINKDTHVVIICPKHGEFKQTPHNHVFRKSGCPKCKESKGERKIRFYLEENNLKFESQFKFESCKNKRSLPFDFVVFQDDKIKAIEYQGEHHYMPVTFGGGDNKLNFDRIKITDGIKKKWCEENQVPLLAISFIDFDNISMILNDFLN